jgi:hypothetical protein
MIALEVMFDYLDGRTEEPREDPLADGLDLFEALTGALARGTGQQETVYPFHTEPDGAYLRSLAVCTNENLYRLPAAEEVAPLAEACGRRCAQAQVRLHAAATLGDGQLRAWASEHAPASGLQWREYIAGCASSVLSMHALIAAAANPATTPGEAQRIDFAYLAIGAVITTLDSLVDQAEDTARGEPGFIRLYEDPRELEEVLRSLTQEALARIHEAPNSAHHEMTLAGVVAFYLTHPDARSPNVRKIAGVLRAELGPTIWAALAVMSAWRGAKAAMRWARPCAQARAEDLE